MTSTPPAPSVVELEFAPWSDASAHAGARCHWCRCPDPDRYVVLDYGGGPLERDDGSPRRFYYHGRCAPPFAGGSGLPSPDRVC